LFLDRVHPGLVAEFSDGEITVWRLQAQQNQRITLWLIENSYQF
jgi:hypothetical protein